VAGTAGRTAKLQRSPVTTETVGFVVSDSVTCRPVALLLASTSETAEPNAASTSMLFSQIRTNSFVASLYRDGSAACRPIVWVFGSYDRATCSTAPDAAATYAPVPRSAVASSTSA